MYDKVTEQMRTMRFGMTQCEKTLIKMALDLAREKWTEEFNEMVANQDWRNASQVAYALSIVQDAHDRLNGLIEFESVSEVNGCSSYTNPYPEEQPREGSEHNPFTYTDDYPFMED